MTSTFKVRNFQHQHIQNWTLLVQNCLTSYQWLHICKQWKIQLFHWSIMSILTSDWSIMSILSSDWSMLSAMRSGHGRCHWDNTKVASSNTSVEQLWSLTGGSSTPPIVSRYSPWCPSWCSWSLSLQDIAPSNLLVRIGEYNVLNLNEPHKHIDRRVKKVVTHRNFDKFTYEYDIALLEMQADIKFQPNIIPICLPNSDSSLVGQIGTVTGWGRLSEFGQISPVLREVRLPIISNSKCMRLYRYCAKKFTIGTKSDDSTGLCSNFLHTWTLAWRTEIHLTVLGVLTISLL